MTAIGFPTSKTITRQAAAMLVVMLASLVAVGAAVALQQLALGIALFLGILALTLRRVRFGLFVALFLLLVLEPLANDPIMYFGWVLQSDISSWTPFRFINFTPIEIMLLVTAVVALGACLVERRGIPRAQLRLPLLLLLGLLAASIGYGLITGGSLNIALWETRHLYVGGLIALLAPALLRSRADVDRLLNLLIVAAILLSVEIVWRRLVVLVGVPATALDLAFDHDTPTFMNFVVMLLLGRLLWPATGRQRLFAVAIPLILYAEMLTNRRAGWIGLDLGLVLLTVFVFRLRRQVFYFLVLPLLVLYGGYLLLAWNADGAWAQPARAVRSIDNPDSRDAASNSYRYLEIEDVRLNILARPLTGLGFGKQYTFYTPLPDLSFWPFWRYEAHNSVLWLWMEMGPFGFMSLFGLVGVGVVRGVQLLKLATDSRAAPTLVALVTLLLMYMVYGYVDLGLVSTRVDALLGLALGVIGVWGRRPEILRDDSI